MWLLSKISKYHPGYYFRTFSYWSFKLLAKASSRWYKRIVSLDGGWYHINWFSSCNVLMMPLSAEHCSFGQEQSSERGFTNASTGSSTPSHGREETCRVPHSLHSVCLASNDSKLNWKGMKNKVMSVTNDSKHSTNYMWLHRVVEGCHGIMRLIIKELVEFNVDKWKGVRNVIFHVQHCLPMQQHSAVFQGWGEHSKPSASGRGNLATWAG